MQNLTASIRNSGALEIRNRLGLISGGKILDVGTQQGSFISTLMKSLKDYESMVILQKRVNAHPDFHHKHIHKFS